MKRKYKEILFFIDTCEAMSLFDQVNAPNMYLVGSSAHHQSAYSHEFDADIYQNLNDYWTHQMLLFFRGQHNSHKFTKKTNLGQFKDMFPYSLIKSDLGIKNTHPTKKLEEVFLYEFLPLPGSKI